MGASVEIKKDNTAEIMKKMDEAAEAALTAVGHKCEEYAKRELNGQFGSPKRIDTGLLRNSISFALGGKESSIGSYSADKANKSGVKKSGTYSGTAPQDSLTNRAVYVGTNVEYAYYVHEGARSMEPNRFLRNAAEGHADEYREIIKRAAK